jgi:hypothetical protein
MSRHWYASILVLLDAQICNINLPKLNLVNIYSLLAVLLSLHSLKLHQLLLLIFSKFHFLVHASEVYLFFALNLI